MGFLQSTAELTLNKCVISVWFRVPSETAAAAAAERNSIPAYSPDFTVGLIPIICFDEQFTSATPWGSAPLGPSFIGVTSVADQLILSVNIQTRDMPVWANQDFAAGWPEWFGNADYYKNGPTVAPDKWHHVLLSWDLGSGSTATVLGDEYGWFTFEYQSSSKMWCAFDDVNLIGRQLPAMMISDLNDGQYADQANTMLSYSPLSRLEPGADSVTVSISPLVVQNIHIPAPANLNRIAGAFVPVREIEMAELQIFTGVALDTSSEAARRTFVDSNGKPVRPKYSRDKDGNLTAAEDSPPFLLLGKLPDVALCQSSGNWINGRNLGTATTEFAKTGTIEKFKPEPELGK